ncbi:hypothetical protein [Deinococcus frigens]|uniref:hypothetical protein n=1 Tax=Deinococcus frigens TaxID=249403 RepID=UPI0004955DB3|nr:hypothetical protein [Deinococcus frigens]
MSDDTKPGYDPANQSPAEGQSQPIPEQDRGQAPNVDPADKDGPAEGARDAVEDDSTPGS